MGLIVRKADPILFRIRMPYLGDMAYGFGTGLGQHDNSNRDQLFALPDLLPPHGIIEALAIQ
ncbi:hypothetical protein GCM10027190_26910 [Spirosoma areae]